MKCQFCNCADSRVVDSRPTDDGNSIRRRRECIHCGRRFTTYEKVEVQQLLVVKKDNSRELFDPQKVRSGIIAACHKRPVSAADIEKLVNSIEQMAYNNLQEAIDYYDDSSNALDTDVENRRVNDLMIRERQAYAEFLRVLEEEKTIEDEAKGELST